MDYQELIEWLRTAPKYKLICNDAADAIETMLAERDALMKDATRCETCLHAKECYFNEQRRNDCAKSNRGHWKWRGPQKGENHD